MGFGLYDYISFCMSKQIQRTLEYHYLARDYCKVYQHILHAVRLVYFRLHHGCDNSLDTNSMDLEAASSCPAQVGNLDSISVRIVVSPVALEDLMLLLTWGCRATVASLIRLLWMRKIIGIGSTPSKHGDPLSKSVL
jgi:hypothetical protein